MSSSGTICNHQLAGVNELNCWHRVFIFLVTVAMSVAACSGNKVTPAEKMPTVVATEQITMASPERLSHYSAVVTPYMQVDVAFKQGGYVERIHLLQDSRGRTRPLQEGDFIHKGAVLARIKPADYESKIQEQSAALTEVRVSDARVLAEIAEASAAVKQAQLDFGRASTLFEKESLVKSDYDAAQARLEICKAKLRQTQAQLNVNKATAARMAASVEEAKLALRDCALVAPIDGVVLKKTVEVGSYVSAGTVGFTLAKSNVVKVVFGVPDTEISNIKKGDTLTVTSEALPGELFEARVTEISPSADPKGRVFNVEASVPNPSYRLHLGAVASLTVGLNQLQKPTVAVPLSAVVRSSQTPDGYSVYVVELRNGKSTACERQVQLGEAFGQEITVLNGIKSGDTIITSGNTRIANGEEIRVLQ